MKANNSANSSNGSKPPNTIAEVKKLFRYKSIICSFGMSLIWLRDQL